MGAGPADLPTPVLTTAIRTLVAGGFVLEAVERNPGFALVRMYRVDEFGAKHQYAFAVAAGRALTVAEVQAAHIGAANANAKLVIVGDAESEAPAVQWDRFLNLFGGPVVSSSALDPHFGDALQELACNSLPDGFVGRPDDLFEAYVRAGLEFILAGRVVRYGQERLFEARPDGIALPSERFRALYDAKAYSHGYEITADTIRQFRSYVDEFTERYRAYIPRLNSFIVVSGSFVQTPQTLQERSTQFMALCGVPLSCLTARVLGDMVKLLSSNPAARRSIDWARVFSRSVVETERVQEEITVVQRDRIIGV